MRDLCCGIGPWHVYKLCENPWNGGCGYTPEQVGRMTLDQIFLLLGEEKQMRKSGKSRISTLGIAEVPVRKDGRVVGRDKDGNLIKAVVRGESLAARLAREERERSNGT